MPTLTEIFGANAAVLTSETSVVASAADPVLVIKFSDLISTGMDDTSKASNPNPWFGAIVKNYAVYSATTAGQNESNNVVVTAPSADSFLTILSRNGSQKLELGYTANFYEPFTGSASFDPDNLV